MNFADLSHTSLVEKLLNDKEHLGLLEEVTRRIIDPAQSEDVFKAFQDVHQTPAPATRVPVSMPFWENCIDQQKCYPQDYRKISSLKDLIQAVADARTKKQTVRAVGSGHSFSNICPTTGILLDPHDMNKFLQLDTTSLKDPSQMSGLVSVQSGITIRDLNTALLADGKALATMGAYDGQTLAGAISTGTHGSGIGLGPIASLVKSLVLVTEKGILYRIEPSDGITDPAKFQPGPNNVILKQDDDWFNSTLIAMGCMGLVYSYTLNVVPAFLLEETRSLTTWQDFKPQLAQGLDSEPFKHRYFEIDLNPYPVKGKNTAISITRDIPPDKTPKGSRGFENWLGGVLAACHLAESALVAWLNLFPRTSSGIIARALETLQDSGYINQSSIVLDIGKVDDTKAYAVELSFDASQDIVAIIDRILDVFQKAAADHEYYLAGPVAMRFVAPSTAYVAPQQGRPTMMVEMDMLDGIKTGPALLKLMKETLCSGPEGKGVRVHWGLDLDTVTKDEVPGMFPEWSKWLAVYKQLNTTGMWNSVFTDRIGITV